MPGDLEPALAAYRAALDTADKAKAALRSAIAIVPVARARLARAIVVEYRGGARVRDLAEKTGYGREQIRRILRAAGVDPDERRT